MNPCKSGPTSPRRWGSVCAALTWWAFYCALISGVVLAFHYRPWGDVFKTVSHLTDGLLFGVFIRKLHYFSGQCFLLLVLAHTLDHWFRQTYRHLRTLQWLKLLLLVICGFGLVFTGFILKGDQKGVLAGQVMAALISEIPFWGGGLARLFLRPGDDFFLLPYLHHTVVLPLGVIFLLSEHRKTLWPRDDFGWPLLGALTLLAVWAPMPRNIPPGMAIQHISGPWFFHGVQWLLRYIPPIWAGVVWPLAPFIALALLALAPPRLSKPITILAALIWAMHLIFLVIAWSRTLAPNN